MNLIYSYSIAGALTTLALEGNAATLQRRLPSGWELTPFEGEDFEGEDVRGRTLRGANLLVVFHEVYAVRTHDGHAVGLPQVSYVAFASLARNQSTDARALIHWCTYTEDPASVPGKFKDGRLAHITRQQTFTKEKRGETHVRETFSAVADTGAVELSLAYDQGGFLIWMTADKPDLPLVAANDPEIVRWYQEDQVFDVVQSCELQVDRTSQVSLVVQGELADVFDGKERIVAVFIRRPYMRQVYVTSVGPSA